MFFVVGLGVVINSSLSLRTFVLRFHIKHLGEVDPIYLYLKDIPEKRKWVYRPVVKNGEYLYFEVYGYVKKVFFGMLTRTPR